MLLDRRTFTAGSAALLSGCATVGGPRTFSSCTPLAPVNVDQSRVIRTMAGLRPYRASGFVVRREQLADKALVHNYGHGGSGITLSWGSSKLATELGLPGHNGPVAVIGAGALGLTTARLVQEAGFPLTVYAAAFPPDTTSNIAGGQIMPSTLFDHDAVTAEWMRQLQRALDYSVRRFQILVGEEYGVRWEPTYIEDGGAAPPDYVARSAAGWHVLSEREHPFPVDQVVRYETMYVETGRFLRQLIRDIELAGGKIQVRRFASPADLATLPEPLIFNCTGLGSRELLGDTELIPVRGQLAILIPQPEVNYAYTGNSGYMFPRPDGIVLGGTFERNVSDPTPQPAAIARIVASHKRFFDGFRCTA